MIMLLLDDEWSLVEHKKLNDCLQIHKHLINLNHFFVIQEVQRSESATLHLQAGQFGSLNHESIGSHSEWAAQWVWGVHSLGLGVTRVIYGTISNSVNVAMHRDSIRCTERELYSWRSRSLAEWTSMGLGSGGPAQSCLVWAAWAWPSVKRETIPK